MDPTTHQGDGWRMSVTGQSATLQSLEAASRWTLHLHPLDTMATRACPEFNDGDSLYMILWLEVGGDPAGRQVAVAGMAGSTWARPNLLLRRGPVKRDWFMDLLRHSWGIPLSWEEATSMEDAVGYYFNLSGSTR